MPAPITKKVIITNSNCDPLTVDQKDIREMTECSVFRAFQDYNKQVVAVQADTVYWCFETREWVAEFDLYGVTTKHPDDITTESRPLRSCYSDENAALKNYLDILIGQELEADKKLKEIRNTKNMLAAKLATTHTGSKHDS